MLVKINTCPGFDTISSSHEAILPYIHKTPILRSTGLDIMAGAQLLFKCENFQKVGAFKMRGAMRAALALSAEEAKSGLATHSSGNHAQAVAMAARNLGVPAYIVMPSNSPKVKINAVEGYGAEVRLCEPTLSAREEGLRKVVEETGAAFIHPFNDYNVIAGAATAAKELHEEAGPFDIVMAPIGGGGLMSGTCLSISALSPGTKLIGAEPAYVDDAYRSLQSGKIEENHRSDTIADGLKTNLGAKTFEILQNHLDRVITVEESEIAAAMLLIWERLKIIVEPSCAVPLAAVLKEKETFAGKESWHHIDRREYRL